MSPFLSVIVPTRDEAAHLPRLLARLQAMPQVGEIIVSDGGSRDATLEVARRGRALIVDGARGRGPQQNAGARIASGSILWFLHADCWPALGCGRQIERACQKGVIGGHFRIQFEGDGLAPRLFEIIAREQARRGTFYGDSGLWITRTAFQQLDGFADWPLFEDYDFARRLRQHGPTATLPGRLRVSNRRFAARPWATLALWMELQLRFSRGESPHSLAERYRRERAR